MEFNIKINVFAVALDDKTMLQIPNVDANELFNSFGEVEGNPDAVAFTANGVTYSAYPKDIYFGLNLEQMAELFMSMGDEQKKVVEHAYEELELLELIAAEHTDCKACDLTMFIESEEEHYDQNIDERGDEK